MRFNGADVYFLTQKELVQMFLNEGARPIKLEVKNVSNIGEDIVDRCSALVNQLM